MSIYCSDYQMLSSGTFKAHASIGEKRFSLHPRSELYYMCHGTPHLQGNFLVVDLGHGEPDQVQQSETAVR